MSHTKACTHRHCADQRIREMERFMMRSTWWLVALGFAGALVIAGIVNLFIAEVPLTYSIGEFCIAIVIIGVYVRSVRRIEAIMAMVPESASVIADQKEPRAEHLKVDLPT